VAEAVETLAGPGLLRMVHTRHGAFVACCVLAFGTPKDRKKAVKAMKGAPLDRGCELAGRSAPRGAVSVPCAQAMCAP